MQPVPNSRMRLRGPCPHPGPPGASAGSSDLPWLSEASGGKGQVRQGTTSYTCGTTGRRPVVTTPCQPDQWRTGAPGGLGASDLTLPLCTIAAGCPSPPHLRQPQGSGTGTGSWTPGLPGGAALGAGQPAASSRPHRWAGEPAPGTVPTQSHSDPSTSLEGPSRQAGLCLRSLQSPRCQVHLRSLRLGSWGLWGHMSGVEPAPHGRGTAT